MTDIETTPQPDSLITGSNNLPPTLPILPLFDAALEHYHIVADNLKIVSETYPFKECDNECTPVDDRAHTAAEALKRARDAEAAGLDVLAELTDRLT